MQLLNNFINTARSLGVPRDSLERYISAQYIPQVQQLKFHALARKADTVLELDEILFGGARGGGKTHTVFAQVALDDCQRIKGLKVLYLRKKVGSLVEMMQDLRQKVLKNVRHRAVGNQIRFPNGSIIYCGHFQHEKDIDNYLGLEYDIIVIEEATQLTQSKFESIATCNRTSKDFKPRIYLTTNPGGAGHTFFKNKFILPWRDGTATNTAFVPAKVQDNKFNNPTYINRLQQLTGWVRRAWLDGDWDVFVGQYFDKFRYDLHSIPETEFKQKFSSLPSNARFWGSFDFGYRHWAVFHLFMKYDGILYVIDESACRLALNQTIAENIKETIFRNGLTTSKLQTIVAGTDVFSVQSNTGLTIADEFGSYGVYLNPANTARTTGASNIVSLLGDLEHGINPRVRILQRCRKLLETLPAMEHNEKQAGDVKKVDADSSGIGGDDAYDCFRYGAMEDAESTGLV